MGPICVPYGSSVDMPAGTMETLDSTQLANVYALLILFSEIGSAQTREKLKTRNKESFKIGQWLGILLRHIWICSYHCDYKMMHCFLSKLDLCTKDLCQSLADLYQSNIYGWVPSWSFVNGRIQCVLLSFWHDLVIHHSVFYAADGTHHQMDEDNASYVERGEIFWQFIGIVKVSYSS